MFPLPPDVVEVGPLLPANWGSVIMLRTSPSMEAGEGSAANVVVGRSSAAVVVVVVGADATIVRLVSMGSSGDVVSWATFVLAAGEVELTASVTVPLVGC